jgi:hypothetical protein
MDNGAWRCGHRFSKATSLPELAARYKTNGRPQITCSVGCVDISAAVAAAYHLFAWIMDPTLKI